MARMEKIQASSGCANTHPLQYPEYRQHWANTINTHLHA